MTFPSAELMTERDHVNLRWSVLNKLLKNVKLTQPLFLFLESKLLTMTLRTESIVWARS